jgi:hypothetical protein
MAGDEATGVSGTIVSKGRSQRGHRVLATAIHRLATGSPRRHQRTHIIETSMNALATVIRQILQPRPADAAA